MNDIKVNTCVSVTATIELTEGELAALEAMSCYGADQFLKAFYIKLGKSYMKPFERDLRELFEKIRTDVVPALKQVRKAREHLEKASKGQS